MGSIAKSQNKSSPVIQALLAAMKEVKRRLQAQGMHVNSRHHGLAIAQGRRNRMRHLMMEFYSLDDV